MTLKLLNLMKWFNITKIWISEEQNMTFLWNEKTMKLWFRDYIFRSYYFLAEVIFKVFTSTLVWCDETKYLAYTNKTGREIRVKANKQLGILQLGAKSKTRMLSCSRSVNGHKFQWPREVLNLEPPTCDTVTLPTYL